ncbi:MAG: hypothetical protein R3E89_08195 [Thiolinea sp.]
MADHSFLDWPFFTARHRELAAALEAWAQAHLPVGHADVDAACQERCGSWVQPAFAVYRRQSGRNPGCA